MKLQKSIAFCLISFHLSDAFSMVRSLSMQNMGYPPLPDPFPPKRQHNLALKEDEVVVRFINTIEGQDVVVAAKVGENISAVAKRAEVKIAYSCRTGLCGTCTVDIEDPLCENKSYRPGYQTIRACQTSVVVLPGCDEMVLDVYRGSSAGRKLNKNLMDDDGLNIISEGLPEAMSRFEDDWEKDFTPDYKQEKGFGKSKHIVQNDSTGHISNGTSRLRAETLENVINLNRFSKRYVPPNKRKEIPKMIEESKDITNGGSENVKVFKRKEKTKMYQVPELPNEKDIPRGSMGGSRIRQAAYQKINQRNIPIKYIQENDTVGGDSEDESVGVDNSGKVQGTSARNEYKREFKRKIRERQRQMELDYERKLEKLNEEAFEYSVKMSNLFPDYSKTTRRSLNHGPYEIRESRRSDFGDSYDAHTGLPLPPGFVTGSMVQQGAANVTPKTPPCSYCNSYRRVSCYQCEGSGKCFQEIKSGYVISKSCPICLGRKLLPCPKCKGNQ